MYRFSLMRMLWGMDRLIDLVLTVAAGASALLVAAMLIGALVTAVFEHRADRGR